MKLLYLCVLLFSIVIPGRVAAIVLSIAPITQSVPQGSQTSFNLNIAGLGNGTALSLSTYDIDIGFDSTLLSYSTTTFGNQLDLFGLGDLQSVTPVSNSINLFELSFDSINDLNSLQSSSFILANITFNTLATGNSPIALSVNALGDASGNSLPATIQNGSVSINDKIPVSVPEPNIIWLFLLGITGLGIARIFSKENKRGVRSSKVDNFSAVDTLLKE